VKQVYSYQEISTLTDRGKEVVFTCHPEVRVSAIQKCLDGDVVTITLTISPYGIPVWAWWSMHMLPCWPFSMHLTSMIFPKYGKC
jgi:hypothetical protein